MSRPNGQANRLLLGYVLTASVLLHLLVLPLWALLLDDDTEHSVARLTARCAEEEIDHEQVSRPCANGVHCPVEDADRVRVALIEEEEEDEPDVDDREPFVLSPSEPVEMAENVEPDENAFSSSVDTVVEEEMANRGEPGALGAASSSAASSVRPPSREAADDASASAKNWGEGERAAPFLELPEVERGPGAESDPDDDSGTADGATGGDSLGDLLPDFEGERVAAATGGGGAGTIDYLKDVQDGDRTLLNRRRVNYSDFFERVKVGVVTHWSPISVYRRRDPTGRIYGSQDRVTVLSVTLRGDGSLQTLYVESASGLDFLDAEAVRAMNAAVPFPNPPEGLKGIDGMVTFRFAFHVDVSTRKFRLFRYR